MLAVKAKRGGAALEYVIVSIFAGAIAVASVSYLSHFVTQKVNWLKEKFSMGDDTDFLPDLGGG